MRGQLVGVPVGCRGRWVRALSKPETDSPASRPPVHNRMPMVLAPGAWDEWLAPGPLPSPGLAQLLAPAPDELLDAYPVSLAANNVRNDGPGLVPPRLDWIRGTG